LLGYSVLEGVGSDITTLPDFVRAKFTRFENWESTSSADHRIIGGRTRKKRKGSDYDILFLHDSICHEIDMRRLIAGSHRKGEQVTTYTIEDASFVVS
jgi:hypothetical protein